MLPGMNTFRTVRHKLRILGLFAGAVLAATLAMISNGSSAGQPGVVFLLGVFSGAIGCGAVMFVSRTSRDECGSHSEIPSAALGSNRSELLQHAADALPGMLYVYDVIQDCNVYVNQRMETALGMTAAEIRAKGPALLPTILHPDDVARLPEFAAQTSHLPDKNLREIDVRLRHASGEYRWVRLQETVATRTPDGAPKEILGIGTDITDQRMTQDALRDREHFIQRITATVPDIIYVLDIRTLCNVYVNRSIEAVLGYSREQIAAMGDGMARRLVHPDDLTSLLDRLRLLRAAPDTVVTEMDYRVLDSNGRPRWFTDRTAVFQRAEDGTVTHIVGVLRDITTRIEHEQMIQERNTMLSSANLVVAAVNSALDTRQMCESLAQVMVSDLAFPFGVLLSLDEDPTKFSVAGSWGLTAEGAHKLADHLMVHCYDRVILRQELQSLEGLHLEPEPGTGWQTGSETANGLSIPLVAEGRGQGLLCVCRTTNITLSPLVGDLFQNLGQQVGAAMRKATLNTQLRHDRERMQAISRRMADVQEEERRRLARELHDEIGQLLTGLRFTLANSVNALESPPADLQRALDVAQELASQVRAMSTRLRPIAIDELGLLPALISLFDRVRTQLGLHVTFRHSGIDRRFSPEIETTVYRIVQEALTNVARHARVKQAVVRVLADSDVLEAHIEDHGAGFDLNFALIRASSGLVGMIERAEMINGHVDFETAADQGTRVIVVLPLQSTGNNNEKT